MSKKNLKSLNSSASLDALWKAGPLGLLPRPTVRRRVSAIGFEKVDILDITGPLSTFAAVNHIIERDYDGMPPAL